ncbi:MFS transporter [Streptomyces sp. NPDC004059]
MRAKTEAAVAARVSGGQAVAGPLVGWAGAPATLAVSSAGMALSGLLASRIRGREPRPEAGERPRLRREITEGLTFVFGHPVLRATVLGDALFNLSLAMYQAMLLVFLERELGLGAFAVGLVLSGMGCGALLGALLAAGVLRRLGRGPAIWLAPLVTSRPPR